MEKIKKTGLNRGLSMVLIIALIIGAVLIPIQSQAGQELETYTHSGQKLNKLGSMYNYNLPFRYDPYTDRTASLEIPGLSFTYDGKVFPAYCLESVLGTPNGASLEYIKPDKRKISEKGQAAIEAIADADLDASELKDIFPTDKNGGAESASLREQYVKQYAIWYTIDILDGRFEYDKAFLSSLTGKLATRYGWYTAIYETLADPAKEIGKVTTGTDDPNYINALKAINYVKDLANKAYDGTLKPRTTDLNLSIGSADFAYDADSESYVSPLINTEITGELAGDVTYTITVSGIQVGEYKLLDSNNNQISEPTKDGFKISIPKNKILPETIKNIEIDAVGDMHIKRYGYYTPEATNQQDVFSAFTTVGKVKDSVSTSFEREAVTGSIDIKKVDADNPNKTLSGAAFSLYDKEGNVVESGVTDENGELSFTDLNVYGDEYGTVGIDYTLAETQAPAGYEKFGLFTTSFALSDEHFSLDFTVKNSVAKTGEIEIVKVEKGNTDIKLEGAEFSLFDQEARIITKGVTDKNGYLKFDGLDVYGEDGKGKKYILVETKAPLGYKQDGLFREEFTLTKDNTSLRYEVKNEKIQVLGEESIPDSKDGSVLGEERTPEAQVVLGQEAKTTDTMNSMVLLLILLVALSTTLIFVQIRTRKEQ